MKYFFSTLILLFAFTLSKAQTNLELANEAFGNRQYTVALDLYQKVLKNPGKKTDVADVKFKVAECYRYSGKADEALQWYDQAKAAGYTQPNYLFHQGNIYLKKEQYQQAQQKFEEFLSLQPGDKDATRLLNNCKFVLTSVTDSSVFTLRNEAGINTVYSDYAPCQVKNLLVFTSSRLEDKGEKVYTFDGQGFSDLYQSEYYKEDKTWSKAKRIGAINSAFNDGVLSYCEKTKTAYFTQCNDGKNKANLCRIFESTFDEAANTFSSPKPIALAFVQKADMIQPSVSADGNRIYFVSKMEGGVGGSDIWMTKKSIGQWNEPVNAGSIINTEFDEMFPVIKDSALYFSSEGGIGYGGLDIFYSVQGRDGWTKPVNMKTPFNSSADDFSLAYNKDNKSGYFSSNRSGGAGSDDIYSFFLTPVSLSVKGKITDVETDRPIAGAKIVLTSTDGTSDTTTTNANGEYIFSLDADKEYKINVLNTGYFGDSRKLSTQGERFSKEFSKAKGSSYDFSIRRIPKEEIRIDNIYYDLDSFVLRVESKPSLDKLVKILEDTPEAFVQINSHTDERGKAEYNNLLSENRAKSVVDYLVNKGISRGRLSSKGFGFSQPVVKGAVSEEDHQKNRRTAFQVIQKK